MLPFACWRGNCSCLCQQIWFSNYFFSKRNSDNNTIRVLNILDPDQVLHLLRSAQIWVQTVYNGYQQRTRVATYQRKRYNKCSKISNTNCLPKWLRQTAQNQIRPLLQKQSDMGLLCFYSDKNFVNSNPDNQYFA